MKEVLPTLDKVFGAFELDCWITATSNGVHKLNSLHYTTPCKAVDVRSKNLPSEGEKRAVRNILKIMLGKDYDILYENPASLNQHFHIELDPK